ncbi:calmodulin-binding transcription activator 3-like isoform X1 [Nicotiana sylvestris]|uniref:Calmodulin-binding transcription activator 3-like isoform X1 n=1 Tax=Nicotiana sylvestris TaxID=4096 RepID=A0A1U7V6U6_NICSY|nr:PREDICTED: calmodulin-binding transcription activator 3-like isoform X1 [Nicotiana sylvestris]XP_016478076.1 PREDICTED: calmodulin-binding transcription activator 3-like isoform X1 [Nicotiana tabacum]
MADSRRYGLNAQLDIDQILLEAQHRWLRPAEICEILKNYQKFRIAPEPPNRPPSGSLFLFDRKVLRYFRKDGHSWRKKKDGKTVKEAHERLKAGSIDVLHCYYAHGEENENFQRRSYWMLEEEMSHIVLVHYREVKGNRTNFSRTREPQEATPRFQETDEDVHSSEVDSSASTKFYPNGYQVNSQVTDATSLSSAQASEYEDAESAYNQHPTSGFHSFLDAQPSMMQKAGESLPVPYHPIPFSTDDHQVQFAGSSDMDFFSSAPGNKSRNTANTYIPSRNLDFPSWETISVNNPAAYQSYHFQPSSQSGANNMTHEQGSTTMGQVFLNDFKKQGQNRIDSLGDWQTSEGDAAFISKWSMDQKLNPNLASDHTIRSSAAYNVELHNSLEASHILPSHQDKHPMQNELPSQLSDANVGGSLNAELDHNLSIGVRTDHSSLKQPLLDGVLREGLKKLDSFDRWMSKELEDVSEPHMQSNSSSYWDNVGDDDGVDNSTIASQVQLDTYMLSPSLSQDQFFSIIDFSPSWAFAGSEIKVLITGKFLKSQPEVEKWACMFGELEVPAEVIADGVLRCHTPNQKVGRVPFYITCSNRLACSEVREFEFRVSESQDVDVANSCSSSESLLHMRFGKLLSLESTVSLSSPPRSEDDVSNVCSKINSLLKEDDNEWEEMLNLTYENNFMAEKVKDQLLQKLLKEKLRVWLLQKVAEGGKGPNVLDEGGQGVLHFAAALGYDWAIPPTIAAGVSVNFRDVNGWTALHWAASYGRERTVGFLIISLGAAPGALTDPTPKHPSGRTPADLASSNGHKGIAGYLAESSLSSHLSSLELKEMKQGETVQPFGEAVQTVSERSATPAWDGDWPHGVSLKDSLAAVRNATQAAARIHQVFRVQSFQRKQLKEHGGSEFGLSDEHALSLLALKTNKAGQHDEPVHTAAVRIQNKFRSWKGRRDYLLIRQRIIKIQAHVRGHQVRNKYKNIIWSVGILEKVILRWRRKGSGLRGFKPEATLTEGSNMQDRPVQEDDYDFLKEGRKQTEQRLQKALARVKSMVQYPEARDQYRRLLNVVSDMKDTTTTSDGAPSNSGEAADFGDDLIDLDDLLDDDTFMSTAP